MVTDSEVRKGPPFTVKAIETWRRPGTYCDEKGGGLYLQVRQVVIGRKPAKNHTPKCAGVPQFETLKNGTTVPKVTKYWVFRYWRPGPNGTRKLKEYGIGPFPKYSLQEAREEASKQWKLVHQEVGDPISLRKERKQHLLDRIDAMKTFSQVAQECWEAHRSKWKDQTATNWLASLTNHVFPAIGGMGVQSIKTTHVEQVLKPIWLENAVTATRVRQRMEVVFNYAIGKDWYQGKNPAAWVGNLDALLVESPRHKNAENHPSLPFQQVGAFMEALRHEKGLAAMTLEFCILTAARSGEVRGATWDEIDFDTGSWTIRPERMKAGKEHTVPLSGRALEILRSMGEFKPGGLIFPAERSGRIQSDTAMLMLIKRMDAKSTSAGGVGWRDPKGGRIVPHGFRASFSTWGQDCPGYHFDHQMVEFCLAHQLENKVKAAYKHGTMVEKRRDIMDAWASYCDNEPQQVKKVLPLLLKKG